MTSLMACPGCKHQLVLSAEALGQRVQCPKCLVEFTAQTSSIPPMEVDPETPTSIPARPIELAPSDTAYEDAGTGRPTAWPALFCTVCGAKFSRTAHACPRCGHPVQGRLDEPASPRRRPRQRILYPTRTFLPIAAAILIPVGLLLIALTFLADDLLRRSPPPVRFWIPFLICTVGIVTELIALGFCVAWLYQAWAIVLREDEEYTPGLMVALLFVPFFNFYWIFRAIPGLSAAVHRELSDFSRLPTRDTSSVPGAGWIPGLVACIIFLVPYAQPVAVCVFLAWMLITNHAIQRLVRFHDELGEEG